jgi:hypothetical protein
LPLEKQAAGTAGAEPLDRPGRLEPAAEKRDNAVE